MPLIGIIAKKQDVKDIKKELSNNYELVELTEKSIKNLKNVKFEEIIINKDIILNKEGYNCLNEIINRSKYLLVNADIEIQVLNQLQKEIPIRIITYGFNSKATLSVSSVKEDYIIISIQREIEKQNKEKIENQERKIEIIDEEKYKTYNKLIKFVIKELHKK